jgi:hypothetical protein
VWALLKARWSGYLMVLAKEHLWERSTGPVWERQMDILQCCTPLLETLSPRKGFLKAFALSKVLKKCKPEWVARTIRNAKKRKGQTPHFLNGL